jgi:hypothetical protein
MATVERTWIFVAAVAAGVLFAGLLAAMAITGDGGRVALVAVVLWVGGYLLVSRFLRASRRPAVEAEARRLGLSFSRRDPFRVLDSDFHPFLHFGKLPGSQGVENVVWGERAGREVRAFEYWRPVAEDEPIRYSCAMVRIPNGWPSLLVRRKGRFDVARSVAGLGGQELELEDFNRVFEVRSDDGRLASAIVDQRMMSWLLESDPVLGFQLQHGWLLAWMPRLPPQEIERVLTMVERFHEQIPRAVWSLYGDGSPATPGF